jgi:hypothetical protein
MISGCLTIGFPLLSLQCSPAAAVVGFPPFFLHRCVLALPSWACAPWMSLWAGQTT